MGTDPDHNLTDALVDVRKAYRLIWLYQRRVVDIIRLIVASFEYKFYVWDTSHIGQMPGQRTTDPFSDERWVWSTLPLYKMSLLYLAPSLQANRQQAGEWMLEIHLDTDAGATIGEDDTEPAPTGFRPPDESETFLRLYAWYCTQDGSLNWLNDIWSKVNWPERDDDPIEQADPPIRLIRKSFELSTLPDKPSVERAIREFKSVLSDHFQLRVDDSRSCGGTLPP